MGGGCSSEGGIAGTDTATTDVKQRYQRSETEFEYVSRMQEG